MDMTVFFIDNKLNERAVIVEGAKDVEAGKATAWNLIAAICEEGDLDFNDFGISKIVEKKPNPQFEEYLRTGLNDPRD